MCYGYPDTDCIESHDDDTFSFSPDGVGRIWFDSYEEAVEATGIETLSACAGCEDCGGW